MTQAINTTNISSSRGQFTRLESPPNNPPEIRMNTSPNYHDKDITAIAGLLLKICSGRKTLSFLQKFPCARKLQCGSPDTLDTIVDDTEASIVTQNSANINMLYIVDSLIYFFRGNKSDNEKKAKCDAICTAISTQKPNDEKSIDEYVSETIKKLSEYVATPHNNLLPRLNDASLRYVINERTPAKANFLFESNTYIGLGLSMHLGGIIVGAEAHNSLVGASIATMGLMLKLPIIRLSLEDSEYTIMRDIFCDPNTQGEAPIHGIEIIFKEMQKQYQEQQNNPSCLKQCWDAMRVSTTNNTTAAEAETEEYQPLSPSNSREAQVAPSYLQRIWNTIKSIQSLNNTNNNSGNPNMEMRELG